MKYTIILILLFSLIGCKKDKSLELVESLELVGIDNSWMLMDESLQIQGLTIDTIMYSSIGNVRYDLESNGIFTVNKLVSGADSLIDSGTWIATTDSLYLD